LLVLGVVIALGPAYSHTFIGWANTGDIATLVSFLGMGVLVILKRPGNLVGWALLLSGLGQLIGGVGDGYAELALLQRPGWGLPAATYAAAFQAGAWALLMAGVFLLLVVFPTGRVASGWVARWTVAVLAGFAVAWLGVAATPGHLDSPFKSYRSPLAPTQDKTAFYATAVPVIILCLLSVAAAAIRAIVRFRRSRGLERQQFKWLAANAALLVLALPVAAAFNYSSLAGAAFGIALILLPFSVGIAVLRYRLYEIDRIVSKTLVYGSLTVILGAAYTGLVLAGQALFSSFAGGSNLAIAASTLVVAAAFLPLRARVQRVVDRRFYRRRYDAQRTLEAFGQRVRQQIDLGQVGDELAHAVRDTLEPTHMTLWLRR
jgi:hypothetical protein